MELLPDSKFYIEKPNVVQEMIQDSIEGKWSWDIYMNR